jgi:DNA-binding protein H-NS
MAYSIRLPDGTLVRNIPDELSPEEAKARIIKAYPQYAPETSTTRRVLGDVPVGVARGGVAGIRMIADLFGADNPASQALKDSEEYLAGLMSAQAQNNEQEMARLLKEAEDKGALESVKLGFQALAAAPVEIMSQVFGSAIPTILTGAAGALAKLGTFGVRTLQAGTGTAMGVGLAKGNIYEVVKEELTNAGIDEKVAEERAKAAQNYTGENWDQIIFSGLLGGAAALGPLERIFARLPAISPQVAAKNIFARSAVAGVAEAAPEAAQAFQEQVAQNIALQREGFDVPTFRGAVANATLEGLAGFGIGAPIGALEGKPGATKPPGQQDPTEPAAPPPPTPIVPEGELTPEEEAELQARIAAAPPPPAAVPVEPTPPIPPTPAPAAVQPVTATPEAVALPEPQQVTPQIPVEAAPELEALTAQLGQIQQARMDPTLTPDDPAFLELDQQEAAIQTRIQQLTATPEAVTQPPAQPLAPPVAPIVEPEVIPAEALVEAPVVTPPQIPAQPPTQPLAPEITPPADVESVITPAVEEPVIEEPVARTKEDVQTELNRIRTSLKKAKTAVKKKLMPESEVTSLETRVSELEDELAEAKAGPRQIKYRSAKGNTWTGKGKSPPKWLREKLAAGYELSDFEIRPELGNKSEVELELEKPLGFGRPAPATRPPPEYERAARELEAAETTKPNLFSALTSKVSSEDAADVGTGPDFAFLRAAKGRGKPISEIISDGELDAYLPPDMRPGSETFNAKKASEYLKDLLRQDPATDPEARLTYESREFLIPILRNELDRLEAELEPEDVNQLIQEIIAEERAAIADLEASAIAEQERGPGVPGVPADFALTGQTPEELAELQRRELSGEAEAERDRLEAEEAARAAAEAERKIADQKRETFDLAPPPSAPTIRAAAPSGDLFGTAGITEQPTRAPRPVAAEPSPIEKLAAEQPTEDAQYAQDALAEYVDSFRDKLPSKGQRSYDAKTNTVTDVLTAKDDVTMSRADFDALVSIAKTSDSATGRKYSIIVDDTPEKSSIFTFQPRGLKATDPRVPVFAQLEETNRYVEELTLDQQIEKSLKEYGLDDPAKASKKYQEEFGISKPVADALVRAEIERNETSWKQEYGAGTEADAKAANKKYWDLKGKAEEISKQPKAKPKAKKAAPKNEEKKLTGAYRLAIRQQNAADRFIDSVVEQFGLTMDQAQTALNRLLKEKVVSLDPVAGQFKLKDGRFWDKEVMRRAAGVEAEAEPEPKKEEKPKAEQFVRGTEEQLKEIKEFAKRYGGSEVAYYDPDKDIGMVLAFGKFDGDPKYIPYIKGIVGRTAFDISVAKFSEVLPYKAELLEAKERLEKAAEKKHQENPFIKFERGIALSDGMDPKIEGIIREWKDMLGLGGINIYFSTTEDAKKNINNFTGPHRRIGSATIDPNERGSMRRMEGGASYYVVFDKSTSTTKMLEVIAHEIGHVHEKVAFDQAPQEVKDKLKAAYEKWLEGRKDKTSREAMQMLRAKTTAQTTDIGQTIETAEQLDKLDPYWSKFSEWYADQVSRWAVTDEKPVGVVEKFFARLGAALRRFYQTLKGQKYLPDETFVQYLNQVKPTIVETIPGPIKDQVNQDMSSKMQTDLFGSPGEAKDIGEAMEVKGKKKLPPGRSPELTAAAQAVQAGTMTAEEFNKLVDVYKPIPLYEEPLKPATSEQVFDALDVKKREQINPQIPNGTKVGLRLDIPAFNRKGVFVVSIHQKRTASAPGKVIGYGSVAKAKNVTFGVGNQLKALEIAAGSAKDALQTIEGEYVNVTPEQAFAEAQRAIKDPSYVQVGIDPTRHAYFYDRRTTLPVVSAQEVIQIGNMILAKNPEFGSKQDFLYNIDAGPYAGDTQPADMSFLDRLFAEDKAKRKEERNETMAYYKSIRRKEAAMQRKVREYGSTLELQRQLNNLNEIARELKEDLDLDKQPVYSAENFLRQARAALEGSAPYKEQAISPEVFAVIQAVYMDDPKLLEGLRLSIKPEFSKQDQELRRAFGMKRQTAGTFMPMQRLINLYTGTRGVTSPMTIRHELTHTLEQMMTEKQRQVLLNSYLDAIKKAMRKHKDAKSQEFFDLVLEFLNNPTDRAVAKMNDAMPSMDFYQYTSPSEYWAVNAEKLMAQRLGGAWDRFKKAIRKVFEQMKKIFGFDNRFAVHDVFDKIMSGSKERMDRRALVDYIGTSGDSFAFLANIEEDAELVRRYNRADTPMLDHSPMRRMIVNAASFTKDTFKDMAQNPSEALRMMFNTLNRGVMYLRNKNIWFGSGINEADRIRYNGQLKTAEGLATASLALDNMVRGGNIATQVVFLGGIEFNKDTQMYSAAQKEKSMEKVYRAEAKLKEKLGDQLAANIINGYGEAKRSRSIKEEVETRKEIVEAINEEVEIQVAALKALDADPKATKEQKDAVNRELRKLFKEYRQAREELNTITKIAEEKVTMSEAEIEDFISREDAHPELKEILDNFGAVNQNLLRFWKDVGLLSDPRYERLAAIKDYVPWYRIMNDEEDVHSPLQATTRSATNIGKEKLFKSGKPSVINDFIIEEGQDVFKIQPSRINAVKLNGVRLKPDQYESTPNGEVRLKVEYKPNDVLVIETQREIENMIDNMTRNVMRMTMNGLRKYAANRIVSEYATRDSKGQVMTFPKVDREKGRFDYIYNGRRTIVEIQDPLIAEAVLGMETVGMEMWKPLAAAANFTRRTITLSPVFQLKQVFKDAPTAALVTGVKNPAALMGGVMRDFVGAVRDNDPVATILRSHGIGGFYSPARTPEADVKRRIGIINNNAFDYTMKALDHFGDSSDMAQRIAIYKRVMAETGDESLALYQAANVINFLRHGSGQVAQALVKTVPFLNAYAQSIDVLFNALVGGGLRGKDRAAALKQLAVTGGLLAGTTLLYAMLVGDDDDYMKMDDQSKIRSYMIPGTDVVLPMNTSAAFFFKAIPELIYNKVVNEGTENEVDAKRLRTAMKEAAVDLLLGPTPVPSAVKPVIEISLDYNFFTSRPITPRGMDNLDAYQQYDMRTSDAARLLSGLTGTKENRLLNPMEADHLVRSIFGTAGAMVAWSSNLIGASSEYRPEMGLKDMPITGAFLRPEVPRGREDLFYKLKENTDRKYRTFNRLIERDQTAEAEAYLNRHPNLIAYYDYTSEMDTQLKEINAAIRFIGETQDPSYTPETKRREIQELLNLKQDILEGIEQFRKEAYAD